MDLTPMYSGMNNSPKTSLAAGISAGATSMTLVDASVLPAAPNLSVLGAGNDAEIVSYSAISGNTVSGLVRGINGTTPGVWAADTPVARNFTTEDQKRIQQNIEALNNGKADTDSVYSQAETDVLLANKADAADLELKAPLKSPALSGTPTAPTPDVSTNTQQIANAEFVHLNGVYHGSGTISAGTTKTFSSDKITADMYVINCVFGTPANVASDVTWTTANGSITFTGTFTGATTVTFDIVDPTTLTLS